MIAHNGDNFDHYVLDKELCQQNLNPCAKLFLHRFDPVRTLKAQHGAEFGKGGALKLEKLHADHVPEGLAEATGQQHQALNDCLLLREVLQHWEHLAGAMAFEISKAFSVSMNQVPEGYVQTFQLLRWPRPLRDSVGVNAHAMREGEGAASRSPSTMLTEAANMMSTGAGGFSPGAQRASHSDEGAPAEPEECRRNVVYQ